MAAPIQQNIRGTLKTVLHAVTGAFLIPESAAPSGVSNDFVMTADGVDSISCGLPLTPPALTLSLWTTH